MHILAIENQFPFIFSKRTISTFPNRSQEKKTDKKEKNEWTTKLCNQVKCFEKANHSSFGTTVAKYDIKLIRNDRNVKIHGKRIGCIIRTFDSIESKTVTRLWIQFTVNGVKKLQEFRLISFIDPWINQLTDNALASNMTSLYGVLNEPYMNPSTSALVKLCMREIDLKRWRKPNDTHANGDSRINLNQLFFVRRRIDRRKNMLTNMCRRAAHFLCFTQFCCTTDMACHLNRVISWFQSVNQHNLLTASIENYSIFCMNVSDRFVGCYFFVVRQPQASQSDFKYLSRNQRNAVNTCEFLSRHSMKNTLHNDNKMFLIFPTINSFPVKCHITCIHQLCGLAACIPTVFENSVLWYQKRKIE